MFDVAVDAMGGDGGPSVCVEAAQIAARAGARVILVGDESTLRDLFGSALPDHIRIHHAADVVGMDEKPSKAVRRKKEASIRVAARLVRDGEARALVSAGNSGAVMAAAVIDIGRTPGVQRPALITSLPTKKAPVALLDLGANIDPTPLQLAQFAVMGACFAETTLGRRQPRVALLANGSEEVKGTELTRAAGELLEGSELNYVGYCEGRDIFEGDLDVVVTDGFTGNVLLKSLEGAVSAIRAMVEAKLKNSPFAALGALLMRDIFRRLARKLDYSKVGGAPLLGVNKPCFVAHGASSAEALANAILSARTFSETDTVRAIEAKIKRHSDVAAG